MGKNKNIKAKVTVKNENKFEQKFNKQKHQVLGQKFTKGIKGHPNHSKSISIKKKMDTLLIEYKSLGKDNLFVDKRIGEKDKNLTIDEKNIKRFKHARNSLAKLYNLGDGDEDELTHAGQKLSQIENFEDPQISDDEDDGKISFEMQKEHFGGGKFDGELRTKSHSDKMAELVLQSIISKNARKKEKNELLNDIEDINNSMKNILPQLNNHLGSNTVLEKSSKPDGLDIKMKMLMFLPKSKPSDRTKSENEKIREEKEKQEKLESERLLRMKIPTKNSTTHAFSVDDLYTNLETDAKNRKKKVTFDIKDKSNNDVTENEKTESVNSDENGSDDEDDEINHDSDDDISEIKSDDNECINDDDNCIDITDDDLSDVLSIASDEDAVTEISNDVEGKLDDPIMNIKKIKDIKNYDDFLITLKQNKDKESLIIEKLQKEFIKNIINVENNEFENLFDYIFKYIIFELSGDEKPNFKLVESLVKPLYNSMQKDAVHSGISMADTLSRFQEEFLINKNACNGVAFFPKIKILIYCKLVSALMSTSDFHHHVCTPTMLFMSQLLNQCRITNIKDLSYGLVISSILIEMVAVSKRFIPEIIQFLSLALFLTNGKKYVKIFEEKLNLTQAKNLDVICMNSNFKSSTVNLPVHVLKPFQCNANDPYLNGSDIKLDLIFFTLELISKTIDLYSALPSFNEIFSDILILIQIFPTEFCPEMLKISVMNINTKILSLKKTYIHLSFSNTKPKPLKLFEPKIEPRIDDRKKLHGSREFKIQQRESMKLKKLKKSSEREIRKDQRFLREHILSDKINKNREREEKTKRIINSLLVQEGEFKNLIKKKKLAGKKKKVPTATLR